MAISPEENYEEQFRKLNVKIIENKEEAVRLNKIIKVSKVKKAIYKENLHKIKCPSCEGMISESIFEKHKQVCNSLKELRDYSG